jgi:hypothetical protein|tara:strand:+ start:239 stop:583 length:345 start_codon:yes stop_codon:yes gene_type:complete
MKTNRMFLSIALFAAISLSPSFADGPTESRNALLNSKIASPCKHLRSAFNLGIERYIKFLLIRKDGEPDKFRLLDYEEMNKFLSTVTATHDYVKCLEGGIVEQEFKKDSLKFGS